MIETKELIDETGQAVDADGLLGDPIIDKIAMSVSEYYPAFVFDKDNTRASFDKLVETESDPKVRGLLRLIQGLYLTRKQHAQELNLAFYRIAMIGKSLGRFDRNIQRAFENTKILNENDKALQLFVNGMAIESSETKKEISNLRRFKKKHEPKLKRLAKYIDFEGDKLRKSNKELR